MASLRPLARPRPSSPPAPYARCAPGAHEFLAFVEYCPAGLRMDRHVCRRCGLVV